MSIPYEKGFVYCMALVGGYLAFDEYREFKTGLSSLHQMVQKEFNEVQDEFKIVQSEQQNYRKAHETELAKIKETVRVNKDVAEAIGKKLDAEMIEAVHVNDENVVVRMPPKLDDTVVKLKRDNK